MDGLSCCDYPTDCYADPESITNSCKVINDCKHLEIILDGKYTLAEQGKTVQYDWSMYFEEIPTQGFFFTQFHTVGTHGASPVISLSLFNNRVYMIKKNWELNESCERIPTSNGNYKGESSIFLGKSDVIEKNTWYNFRWKIKWDSWEFMETLIAWGIKVLLCSWPKTTRELDTQVSKFRKTDNLMTEWSKL